MSTVKTFFNEGKKESIKVGDFVKIKLSRDDCIVGRVGNLIPEEDSETAFARIVILHDGSNERKIGDYALFLYTVLEKITGEIKIIIE